jgi:hypothetical protein
LSELDAAIMMKKSAFDIVKEKLLARERPNNDLATSQNKQRHAGGNAAVNTVTGATGHIALHQSARRNKRLNKEALKKNSPV